jgi:Fe-S-cluster containining protein
MAEEVELELFPPYPDMAEFYRDVERNVAVVLDAYSAEGIAPTCLKGCDACCHQLVMTTVAEAEAAAAHLQGLGDEDREQILARLDSWLAGTASLRDRLQAGADGDLDDLVEGLAAEYWSRRVPCPFLVDQKCAIYEARPLACRHHFSVSDPDLCYQGDEQRIGRMEAMEEAFFVSQDAIPEEEAEIGMFPELVNVSLVAAREGVDQAG